jgi:hypothetical protein
MEFSLEFAGYLIGMPIVFFITLWYFKKSEKEKYGKFTVGDLVAGILISTFIALTWPVYLACCIIAIALGLLLFLLIKLFLCSIKKLGTVLSREIT